MTVAWGSSERTAGDSLLPASGAAQAARSPATIQPFAARLRNAKAIAAEDTEFCLCCHTPRTAPYKGHPATHACRDRGRYPSLIHPETAPSPIVAAPGRLCVALTLELKEIFYVFDETGLVWRYAGRSRPARLVCGRRRSSGRSGSALAGLRRHGARVPAVPRRCPVPCRPHARHDG